MNIRAFYESIGADYDAFLQRMGGREGLVEKYLRIFMADPTYEELSRAMAQENFEEVEMKAHTLKGIALNLNLEKLSTLCTEMGSSVRSGDVQALETQFEQVKETYTAIIKNLGSLWTAPF